MIKNMGTLDRVIRLLVGIGLVWFALYQAMPTVWIWVLVIIGLFLIITGLSGYCPVYHLLKISTNKK